LSAPDAYASLPGSRTHGGAGPAAAATQGRSAFFIFWGTKVVRRRLGYIADYCPICRDLRTFKMKRVGLAGHIYYISFGEGSLAGHVRTCVVCDVDLDAQPDHYLAIHPHKLEPQELAELTNPNWRRVHAERIALAERLAAGAEGLSAQDRAALLWEPFHLLTPKCEERFRSSHFDLRTLGAIVALIVLVWLASLSGKLAPSVAFAAGMALVVWQVTQIKHRWFREKIFPTLVPALRPLAPGAREIQDIVRELRRRGAQIGKKLDPERLVAALADDRAAAVKPAQVALAAPAPAPAAAMPQQAEARPVVLKLKYGGVRQRFSAADGEIRIGRASDVHVSVVASHVSRHHAIVRWDGGGHPVLVNQSKSGTSVWRDRAAGPVAVPDSMRLEGAGRIGLADDFTYAEAHKTVVVYELKNVPGDGAGGR
jgi:hypothetical protein